MALKALMLKKNIDSKRKALEALQKADEGFKTREAELEQAIQEATTDEERTAVAELVDAFDAEKADHEQKKTDLDEEIRGLEAELDELESKQEEGAAAPEPERTERKDERKIMTRKFFGMNVQERDQFFARDDVKQFLRKVRQGIAEKRAISELDMTGISNIGLLIPEVALGLIRENIMEYSKLYKHVTVRQLSGEGRMVVMGTIPEAVWTDCCADLNELSLGFNDVEVNCWKVGGYFAVCNATLEDSDIDLMSELLTAIGQAIGLALDNAILYGTGTRMPLGIVTRLNQTEAPADYPATARPWVDLSASNVLSTRAGGIDLFKDLTSAASFANGKYSRGERVWVMNERTYAKVISESMSTNASGAIVAGINGTMPAIGGTIEVLDFIPDDEILCGYFDLYLLAERAGAKFTTSEHVRFLADQTVMKGTARYDGTPVIPEGFVVINLLDGTTE